MNRILPFGPNPNNKGGLILPPNAIKSAQNRDMQRAKTAQQSTERFHKFMMTKIETLITPRKKFWCRTVYPAWLNNLIARFIAKCPSGPTLGWALKPMNVHPAYRFALLVPLVLPGTILRVFVLAPLKWLQARIWLWGVHRNIESIDENTVEMKIWTKAQSFTYRQDWRFGIITEIRADGTQKQVG